MHKKPKKGDIVFIDGWGGVVGEVVHYKGDTLTLTFPSGVFRFNAIQPFSPVRPDIIEVLDAKKTLERMAQLIKKRLDCFKIDRADNTRKAIEGFRI
jgi:hypothetical protein